jgi:hypothetical protein
MQEDGLGGCRKDGMYSTPERVRAAVRKAVNFGKWFPLAAKATAERTPSLQLRFSAHPIEPRELGRKDGRSIPASSIPLALRPLRARLSFLRGPH